MSQPSRGVPGKEGSDVLASFLRHQSFLKRFIRKFLHRQEDVDEVVQESFLKAYATELQRPIEKPKSFLFQIARNEALSRLRKQTSRIVEYIEEIDASLVAEESAPVDEQVEQRRLLGVLCESVAALPPQCRRAFVLRMVYGMSHKEVARSMGISVSTVEKHLALALQRCSQFAQDRERAEIGDEDMREPPHATGTGYIHRA